MKMGMGDQWAIIGAVISLKCNTNPQIRIND